MLLHICIHVCLHICIHVNPALWLATEAGKVGLSCPSGLPVIFPQVQFSIIHDLIAHIRNFLLTMLVQSRWQDVGLVLLLCVYRPRWINMQTKNLATVISCHLDLTLSRSITHIYHLQHWFVILFFYWKQIIFWAINKLNGVFIGRLRCWNKNKRICLKNKGSWNKQ